MRPSTLSIKTPEGVVFSQLLAGPVTRFLAWSVDLCCISAALTVLGRVLTLLGLISPSVAPAVYVISYFALSIGYAIVLEWLWRGQTIGKKLFRLRVVDVEGLRLQFDQIATRNLLRFVDSLPALYFVGGVSCWFSSRGQRLGDLAANTIVVRNLRLAEPDLEQLLAGKFNSLRQYPHLAARLRQRVSPREAAVALQSLLRREEFDPAARVRLFEAIATHFRSKVEFPAEATDGVADEQYIRNVVDIVYRETRRSESRVHPGAVPTV
jgi:uncharacterized RDD family membrane protein YckC